MDCPQMIEVTYLPLHDWIVFSDENWATVRARFPGGRNQESSQQARGQSAEDCLWMTSTR